jgi:hypothetical protein
MSECRCNKRDNKQAMTFKEQILEALELYDGYDMANAKDGKTHTADQIIEAVNKILPEKSDHTPQSKIHVNKHDHDYPCCATTEARNQTIDQIERAINE